MNLDSWFKDEITIQRMTGVDNFGQPTYGSQKTVKCRVEHDMKKIVDASGQEATSDAQIALSEKVGLQDRIWLPGTDTEKVEQSRLAKNYREASSKNKQTTMMMLFM